MFNIHLISFKNFQQFFEQIFPCKCCFFSHFWHSLLHVMVFFYGAHYVRLCFTYKYIYGVRFVFPTFSFFWIYELFIAWFHENEFRILTNCLWIRLFWRKHTNQARFEDWFKNSWKFRIGFRLSWNHVLVSSPLVGFTGTPNCFLILYILVLKYILLCFFSCFFKHCAFRNI